MSLIRDALHDFFHKADLLLLSLCIAATLFGVALIYSATQYDVRYHSYALKQLLAMVLGIACYVVFSYIDLEVIIEKWKWLLLGSIFFMLLLLTPLGDKDLAAKTGNLNWLNIPGLPFNIQPAELVKMAFILLLAKQLVWLQGSRKGIGSPSSVAQMGGNLLFFAALIMVISHDMGMAAIYVGIFLVMSWCAGVNKLWYLGGGTLVIGGGALGLFLLSRTSYWESFIGNYRIQRFLTLWDHDLDPLGIGWHQTRSLLAIGSGQLTGQGYLNGIQTQSTSSGSLPERHTDFIFAVCGEELGLIGCAAVLLLLSAIILRCLYVGLKAPSKFSSLVAIGFAGMLLFQVMLNVGMCLFVAPVIGITLPFFSYGGSSLLTMYISMGIVSGIKMRSLPSWLKDRSHV